MSRAARRFLLPDDEYVLSRIENQRPGLYGFIAKSGYEAIFPDRDKGKEVFYQGSRQIDNASRRYYEKQLGAGYGPGPSGEGFFGYTEPVRRFVQREDFSPQANEIPNTMPSWMPGDDYLTNFKVGDPYAKIDQGYARLPGAGYEALHPELKGVKPENYPDIYKLEILSDIAPYSREYNIFRQKVSKAIGDNTRSLPPAGNKNSRA